MKSNNSFRTILVSIHIEASTRAVPLGSAMIASAIRRENPDIPKPILLDFYLDDDPADMVQAIVTEKPSALGFSVALWNRKHCIAVAVGVKKALPGILLFAGGPEVRADLAGSIDYLLPGEAEETASRLIGQLAAGEKVPPGIIRPSGTLSLESLSSPWLDGTLDAGSYPGLVWELSRGCPYRCDFCFESRGEKELRYFPRERLEKELTLFAESGVGELFVLDPTFNHSRKRTASLLKLFEETAPHIHYNMEVRSEYLDRESAELFSRISCSLQIGMQSVHPEVLKLINRSIDFEDFSGKVLLLHEAGVTYGFDLIYGLPGDTLQGFLESLDAALSMAPNHLDIFPLSVLPGTRLAETADGLGLVYQKESPYQVISSKGFTENEMIRAARIASAVDLFYNKGRAVPWFDLLLSELATEPSQLFSLAADLLPPGGALPGGDTLLSWQCMIAEKMLQRSGKEELAGLAADIIALFTAWSNLEQYPEDGPVTRHFNYKPLQLLDLLENGLTDFRELSYLVEPVNRELTLVLNSGVLETVEIF
jgi:radical SAM superfamily enzyme YgiQ (UPF0313 family)